MLLRATILLSGVKWTIDALFTEEITRGVLLWSWTTFKFQSDKPVQSIYPQWMLQGSTWHGLLAEHLVDLGKNFLVWGPTSRKFVCIWFFSWPCNLAARWNHLSSGKERKACTCLGQAVKHVLWTQNHLQVFVRVHCNLPFCSTNLSLSLWPLTIRIYHIKTALNEYIETERSTQRACEKESLHHDKKREKYCMLPKLAHSNNTARRKNL